MTLIFPLTVNSFVGHVVPIPIRPSFLIVILSRARLSPSGVVRKDIFPGISSTAGVPSTEIVIPAAFLNVLPSYPYPYTPHKTSELVTAVFASTVHFDFARKTEEFALLESLAI